MKNEGVSLEQNRPWLRRATLGLIGLGASATVAYGFAAEWESDTQLGPHRAEMTVVAGESYAQINEGSLGTIRLPLQGAPLTVRLQLQESIAPPNLLGAQYSALITNPEGEIDHLKADALRHLGRSLLAGIPVGVLITAGGVSLVESRARDRSRRQGLIAGVSAAALVGCGGYAAFGVTRSVEPAPWQKLSSVLEPDVYKLLPTPLKAVEVRGTTFDAVKGPLQSFVQEKFVRSAVFYATMRKELNEKITNELPPKQDNELRILLVSDRHDNINMDPLTADIVAGAEISGVMNLGDNVSSSTGYSWEAFSNKSFVHWMKPVKEKSYNKGNHDPALGKEGLLDSGFLDNNDMKVHRFADLSIIGAADPRSSDVGMAMRSGERSTTDVGKELADAACASQERIDIVATHDPRVATETVERGCATIGASGHMHSQKGPLVVAKNGHKTYQVTTGTVGGAEQSIAIGPLSVDATLTQLSFTKEQDGTSTLAGWWVYTFSESGEVNITPFTSAEPVRTIWDSVKLPRHTNIPIGS